jgi:hypothetical protein
LKRFEVNDKFAGKSGPCPKCKQIIKVPDKAEEVVVHAPTEFEHGGRGVDGKLALKPIDREESKITPLFIASIAGSIVLVFVLAFVGNSVRLFQAGITGTIFCAVGLLLVSPPTAMAGYAFLRNNDLEPHRGTSLYIRSLICGAIYAILWAIFTYAFNKVLPGDEIIKWGILVVPFIIAGTAAAWVSFDLEPGNAFCHYAFYLLVTNLLRWAAGLGWIWQMAGEKHLP